MYCILVLQTRMNTCVTPEELSSRRGALGSTRRSTQELFDLGTVPKSSQACGATCSGAWLSFIIRIEPIRQVHEPEYFAYSFDCQSTHEVRMYGIPILPGLLIEDSESGVQNEYGLAVGFLLDR